MVQVAEGCDAWSSEGGDLGFLILHGFTANPFGLRPWAEALAGHGFAVELPRLPGHGTRWQDLAKTTWRDWTREAVAAFERLRARTQRQFVGGLSMGGALSLYLAQTRPADVAGLVLVNPAVFYNDPRNILLPVLKRVLPTVPAIANDINKPGGDERAYDRTPLKPYASLFEFWKRLRPRLGDVTAPTLILTSRQDHLVDPANSAFVMSSISSPEKEQVWLEHSFHVAPLDYDFPELVERTVNFAHRVAGVAHKGA
jgi:carboxylesterase